MISWYSISLIIVAVLLTMLVIRLSEISTRMQTLENATALIVDDNARLASRSAEYVTHAELTTILRHHQPAYFTVGR
jgi:hypothetical protein